ncbi:MAG: DEAD/DEAH box helicase [Cupriavidus sp.]|jgi:SWI/SNF-related matrix-associated actin-dependent regulator 1 of chromatin subfamily A|nr:MAG: DEAD/DEAH box helicase [Cupriavidus sp.]
MIYLFEKPKETRHPLSYCEDEAYAEALVRVREHRLAARLAAHQIEGAAFVGSRRGALLCDGMGMGKTRSVLAGLVVAECLPALVVCPVGARTVWAEELAALSEGQLAAVLPTAPEAVAGEIVVVSYSQLARYKTAIHRRKFRSIVLDEAQYVKNEHADARHARAAAGSDERSDHRTVLAFEAARHIRNVYCVTGTPILSRPRDLFNLLRIVRHPLGRSFREFADRYCAAKYTDYGMDASGASHMAELAARLHNVVLMRKKDLLHLPPKRRQCVKFDLEGRFAREYGARWGEYVERVLAARGRGAVSRVLKAKHMVRIGVLRRAVSAAKVPLAAEIARRHPGKVVIFSAFVETLAALKTAFGTDFVTYDGALGEKARARAVRAFQDPAGPRYFLAQLDSAKTAISLVAATLAIIVDYAWTPEDLAQAEDRIWRIGQTRPTEIAYLHARGTIDDHCLALLAEKRRIIRAFTELPDPDLPDFSDVIGKPGPSGPQEYQGLLSL